MIVVAALGGAAALAGCSLLLNDAATQCRDDVDCARFSGSVCDRAHGLCVVGPSADASSSATGGAVGTAGNVSGDGAVEAGDAAVAIGNDCPDLDGNGVADCLESLLVNPDFDRGITGWRSELGMTQSFPSLDANGKSGSGSLAVTNPVQSATAPGLTMGGSAQCVPDQGNGGAAAAAAEYDLYLQAAVVPVSNSFAEAGASVAFYQTADCSGASSGATMPNLVDDSVGGWHVLQDIVRAPAGTRSMLVRLVVVKPFKQAASQALFDNILLRARR